MGDTFHENYQGAPSDGSTWRTGSDAKHVLRGGSWYFGDPNTLTAATRIGIDSERATSNDGVRCAHY